MEKGEEISLGIGSKGSQMGPLKLCDTGVLDWITGSKIFKIFAKTVNKQCYAMMDSTYIQAHRRASTCACKDKYRKIGISRGGKTTKTYILCNEAGIPFEYIITGGVDHEVKVALVLLGKYPIKGLIADRAYGSPSEIKQQMSLVI